MGRFRHELIGEMQPQMKLLAVVAFIYSFLPEIGGRVPSAAKITQHCWISCAVLEFALKSLPKN